MLESVAQTASRGSQRPGLLHLPDGSDAYIDDALYLCGEWGFNYDDAQELVLGSSLREQPDGRWAAKEVGVEEPRQNGKGEIIEGREALGLFYLDERKLIHSAHEFATASEALDRMDDRIGRNPTLKRRVKSVKRSHGEEGVYLRDGRKLLYKTRTKGGGRGFSADLLILDEAMYIAEAFLGALMPVISARPNPQMWYTGSAVDRNTMDNGVVFARLRQRALEHRPGRMAYFGWSAAYEDGRVLWDTPMDVPREATRDPDVIGRGNPALGIRIDLEHVVETERDAMDHVTFCVERLGVGDWPDPDGGAGQVIADALWRACIGPKDDEVPEALALDVAQDRGAGAIGAASAGHHIKVLDHGPGTGWVVARAAELYDEHRVPFYIDEKGPAASLIEALENKGVQVETVTGPEYARACGAFYDAVDQGVLSHEDEPELNAAVKGAAWRTLGDAHAWSRRSSAVDISPLVACTLALRGVDRERESVYEDRGLLVITLD